MLEENSDASIINYAIQIISNKYIGFNTKKYYIKQIHHLVLLYPYLVGILDEFVFEKHSIDNAKIKEIATDMYNYGIKTKIYEACSYSIFWALKYDFEFDFTSLKTDSINSLDSLFLITSFRYDKKHNRPSYLKEYKDLAKTLKLTDFDQYWLFIYEILPWPDLVNEYKKMKKADITFIKAGY
ncbi:MAG: hypothetical protein HYZ42_04350 [Bacteroidetes bacterium]|nr:hypothetical protein [Bacteroidota bacterium]